MSGASAPSTVQRYELADRIAKGGMGEVYRARAFGPHGFSKDVAIKRILPHLVHPEFEQRFIAEAKVAARLSHANIVSVLDFGREGDALFIAMEYVDGVDLATLLAERLMAGRPLPLEAAVHIAIGICTGLDFAHEQGVLHRDVSPANVLLSTAGEVKIADFGLAKAGGGGPTRANRVMGKWRYMSPEQSRAEPLDRRSDLFAAAVVIHELFTGRPLFTGRDAGVIVDKIRSGDAPPASSRRPDLPPVFDAVLARALEVDRERRYPSGEEMARALTEACYSCQLIHTAKDVANLVRESSSSAPAPEPPRPPTEATAMELSEVDEEAGVTRTIVRSRVDDAGLSHWNVTTTFHTTAEVSPMPPEATAPRRRILWPAIASVAVTALIAAIALAARDDDQVAAGRAPDASMAVDEIDAGGIVEIADAAPTPVPGPAADAAAEPAPAIDAAVPTVALRVTSTPSGAAVTLDGKRLGTTPLTAALVPRPGRGRLRIAKSNHKPVEVRVSRERGGKVHRRLEPLMGTIKVGVTESWAKVYVGGRYVGDTPLRSLTLPHGKHRLRLENPETGKSRTVTVTVPSSKPYVFKL